MHTFKQTNNAAVIQNEKSFLNISLTSEGNNNFFSEAREIFYLQFKYFRHFFEKLEINLCSAQYFAFICLSSLCLPKENSVIS